MKAKSPFFTALLILLFSITAIVFASKALYEHTTKILVDNLRERILSVSITAATQIDAEDLDSLQNQDDWKKPQWSIVVNTLNEIKYSNKDIVFIYIFRKTKKDPTKMEFVADADSIDPYAKVDVNNDGKIEIDGPDKLQWPGQPYPQAKDIPEAFEAYEGPITTRDLYTDEYGTVITGYAPIKDSKGNTVAVLAADVKADDFIVSTSRALKPFFVFIVLLTLFISFLIIVITYVWKSYSESLSQLNKVRAEFVSVATHHIASPLTVLKGYTSMLVENGNEPRILSIIEQSSDQLVRVISDFAEAYRIDEEKIDCVLLKINLDVVLEKIITKYESMFFANKVTVFHEGVSNNIEVIIDEEKFTQVLQSIFNNSLKYTKIGSVSINTEIQNKHINILIKDTGIRDLPAVTGVLLKKFSNNENQFEASVISKDLSLYTAKKLMEAHNGSLSIKEDGTFIISLPL